MHSRYSHILFHLLLVTILNAHGANPYDIINSVTADAVTEWKILCADDGRPRRLYGIAGSTVFVVDLDRNQVIKQFTSEFAVDAFALVPKYHCAFYLAGRDSKLNVLDLNTFKLARGNGMKAGKRPEAVVIKSDASMGYVLNAGDPSVTVFEPDDGDLVGTIPLPGTPRSAVYDQKSHGLFISIGDRNEIAFAVPRAKIAIKTWLVSPGE